MNQENPYTPPLANVAETGPDSTADIERLNRVASGQRLLIIAILVSMCAVVLQAEVKELATLVSIFGAGVGIMGVVRTAGALGSGPTTKILFSIAMLLPLFNLLVMASLSGKATKALRAAGYDVGFFGASQK